MMARIFSGMKQIRYLGGIKLTLDFGKGRKNDVIKIPVIQFIIDDCKWNDLLCGRKGVHSLNMKGLCRDCDIKSSNGENNCFNSELT